jgi:hypothetical protein
MEDRLYYLGKCKPKELKLYFDKVYDFYKGEADKKGYRDNEIIFQEERKWVKVYVKIEIEI